MPTYDPSKTPNAEEWLALDESERLYLVEEFHRRKKVQVPRLAAHAAIHVIVENQIAEGLSGVTETLARLQSEGLDRHDAVHAMGSVVAQHIANLVKGSRPAGDPTEPYLAALKELTAASWRRSG